MYAADSCMSFVLQSLWCKLAADVISLLEKV